MARTTLASRNLGGARTPQEVKQLRRSSFELHESLGFPVIHKHRWNEQDLREGLVQRCPLHDDLYDSDPSYDNVCFGTGYVGGFSDPVIVNVTLQDAATDTIKISANGTLIMDTHPSLTAPWNPEIGDGDLIILADFEPGTWDIADTHERYELKEVTPITMRGPHFVRQPEVTRNRFRISQQANVDKLPWGHPFYDVPIVFDPSVVPPDPTPDDPGVDPGTLGTYSESYSYGIRIRGSETGLHSEYDQAVRVAVQPDDPSTSTSQSVRIVGGGNVVVHLD